MNIQDSLGEVDAIFDRFATSEVVPGFAFGIVLEGELVHSGSGGTLRVGETAVPGPDSVFRIASMTKSFTAAAVLLLRDEGRLRLDDPVAAFVPELAELAPWSRDGAPITIRSLLTMAAGFPTDDPWGDRNQDQSFETFRAFLAAGPGLAWPVGTRFEYANLGFAILGLVIAAAAGDPYRAFVERRILAPLGLTSTAYDPDGYAPERVAAGYVRRNDAWIEESMAAYGAFAPMGGLFTTIRDLAVWVGDFSNAFPARDDPDGGHPLARATRREMQQAQRPIPPELRWTSAAAVPTPAIFAYGFGLDILQDMRLGTVIAHGGGYPGFGSHMRWHPASGIGVVGLSNGRYGPVYEPSRDALDLLVTRSLATVRRPAPWDATIAARASLEGLIAAWDDAVADRLFSSNVALDEPYAERRAAFERLRVTHGSLVADATEPPEIWSVAGMAWWLRAERGRVKIELLMSPDRPPRIQWYEVTSVPEPPARLAAIAARIVELLGTAGPSWPADLALSDGVDRAALDRELRATEALFAPLVLGQATAGDGATSASWKLTSPRGDVLLKLAQGARDGPLTEVSLVPVTVESPVHAV